MTAQMISNEHGMCGVNLLDSVAPSPTHLLNFGRRVQHKKSEGEINREGEEDDDERRRQVKKRQRGQEGNMTDQ